MPAIAPRRHLRRPLSAAVLVLLVTTSAPAIALAAGGQGGGTDPGPGGTGYAGAAGGDAVGTQWVHAGGGGGGAGGGQGGAGAAGDGGGGAGGRGGNGGYNNENGSPDGDGQAGQNGAVGTANAGGGSGGGGGAGGAGFYIDAYSIPNLRSEVHTETILGGKGGAGGKGWAKGGAGGSGGDGGAGVVMAPSLSLRANVDSITGGVGGRGGDGADAAKPAIAGNGGNGGEGILMDGAELRIEAGIITGGNGGAGGNGGPATNGPTAVPNPGSGGNGGDGGAGIGTTNGTTVIVLAGSVVGGNGATGGNGTNADSLGGTGGAGGAGINGTGDVDVQAGTSVTGGNGGAGGTGGLGSAQAGAGGAGIRATGGVGVIVAGTVSGGMGGTNNAMRADAISLYGGGNSLVLHNGYTLTGNAVSYATNDTLELGGSSDGTFDVSAIGTGFVDFDALSKTGASVWTLTGTSSFAGPSKVTDGTLKLNGSLASSAMTVASGGTLKGTGTLGALTVETGGTLAPGNGIGTLAVSGNLTLQLGSTYTVEVAPNGTSDKVFVSGTATLAGTVVVTSTSGASLFPSTPSRYTILTSNSDMSTQFDGLDNELAFFDGVLDYSSLKQVDLVLTRNDTGLADVAKDGNQKSTAGAVESLGSGNDLYTGILGLSSSDAQSAYEQLSGEGLGAGDQGQQQSSGLVSTAIVDRVNKAFDALDGAEASGYMPVAASGEDYARSIWVSVYAARSSVAASTQNAASATDTAGLTFGLDGEIGDWTVGVMGGYGRSANTVAALGTTIGSSDYSAGVYAGTEWDSVRLALGAVYTHSAQSSTRNITLPSMQTLTADYAGSTASLFGEASNEFDFGAVSLTPYAGVQYVRSSGAAYTEQGGSAALSVAARASDTVFTTVGLRAAADFAVGEDMLLTLGAGAGWKRAFANQGTVTHSFASGGNSFAVSTADIPSDRLAVEASAALDVSSSLALDLGYTGEFTAASQTNQVQAGLKGSF